MNQLWLWLPVVLASGLAACFVLWPLRRHTPSAGPSADAARVYRAQLDELDREREDGRIGPAEHQSAKAEVARRLLAASAVPAEAAASRPSGAWAVALVGVLLPAAAAGLYLVHGSPGMPSVPFAEAKAEADEAEALLARLRGTVMAQPAGSDGRRQGLVLLGGVERRRGNWPAAEAAWSEALAIRFEASLAEDLAETMTVRSDGVVPPEARAWLERVRASGVTGPRLVYLLARSDLQAGRAGEAIRALEQLLADAPADAPWRGLVTVLRDEARGAPGGGAGSPAGEVARVAPAVPREGPEAEMIAGMVARLEARLIETPEDGEGWLRLARAKRVLGDRAAAAVALGRAALLLPGDPRVAEEKAALEG